MDAVGYILRMHDAENNVGAVLALCMSRIHVTIAVTYKQFKYTYSQLCCLSVSNWYEKQVWFLPL
jgi:hypothetical protein